MRWQDVVAVDFETEAIEPRPHYPPKPVGVALKFPEDRRGSYLAWGHPSGNNCSKADAARLLKRAWRDPRPKLFHNAKFDMDVAEEHFGLRLLPWDKFHDTMFLLFLSDPHRDRLSLKESAELELGMAPTERDAVRDWVLENVPGATRKGWGAHISRAPGDLVGRYAVGDLVRPLGLFRKLYPRVTGDGMRAPYDRERRVLEPLLRNERRGVTVDVRRMEADLSTYEAAVERAEGAMRRKLGVKEMNFDSGPQLADALDMAGMVEEWVLTPKGNRSSSKDNLAECISDRSFLQLLTYRNSVATSLSHFVRPWLRQARETGGIIHTSWNQVRQDYRDSGSRDVGTRTGRLSSIPNFQNMTKKYEESELASQLAGFSFKRYGLPMPPPVRDYIVAPPGRTLMGRDYSQQELRIMAHYENGQLMHAYNDNYRSWLRDPSTEWLDQHSFAREMINGMLGTSFARRPIKNTGFGLIYGMGVGLLAKKNGTDVDTAKALKEAYLSIFPGLKALDRELKRRGRADEPIRTWGGRVYHVEPAKVVGGRLRTFEYKLLNVLVQGSAADCMKEALVRYHEARGHAVLGDEVLLTVHDELLGDAPTKAVKEAMKVMKDAMESVEFDVPMLSDGKVGRSWGSMRELPTGE